MKMQVLRLLHTQKVLIVLLLALVMTLGLTTTTQAAPAEAPAASNGVYHTVRWGETLSGIAVRYGTTVQAIMQANPQIWNPNLIFAGQVLFIPSVPIQPPSPPPVPPPSTYCRAYHHVTYGDTMIKISRWYGVNAWTIAQANNIYNLNLIFVGQVLCIP